MFCGISIIFVYTTLTTAPPSSGPRKGFCVVSHGTETVGKFAVECHYKCLNPKGNCLFSLRI